MVTGPGTLFKPDKRSEPAVCRDIFDGTSNTLSVVETIGADYLWIEPRDLSTETMSFTINDPSRPSISSHHPGGGTSFLGRLGPVSERGQERFEKRSPQGVTLAELG